MKQLLYLVFIGLCLSCNTAEKEKQKKEADFQQKKQELADYVKQELALKADQLSKIDKICTEESKNVQLIADEDMDSHRKNIPVVKEMVARDMPYFYQHLNKVNEIAAPVSNVLYAYHELNEYGQPYSVSKMNRLLCWWKNPDKILDKIRFNDHFTNPNIGIEDEKRLFMEDLQSMPQVKYLAFINKDYFLVPEANEETKTFTPGYLKATVNVYDLESFALVSSFPVYVTNKGDVYFQERKYSSDRMAANSKAYSDIINEMSNEVNVKLKQLFK